VICPVSMLRFGGCIEHLKAGPYIRFEGVDGMMVLVV